LASLIVLLFLRNIRSTLIVALTIPSSIVGTFVFFYFFDFTLNTMTLMALSLSIGVLIDDSIVVLENIYRHKDLGATAEDAARSGSDEVGMAVVATTLANCAVFVPIAFLSGVVGQFFREFGLVAACAVATSTLVALTITPMLCARFMRSNREESFTYRKLETGSATSAQRADARARGEWRGPAARFGRAGRLSDSRRSKRIQCLAQDAAGFHAGSDPGDQSASRG